MPTWRSILVVAILLVAPFGGAPIAAYAADDCDTVVVDDTVDQVLGDISVIENAASRLDVLGADVRVRAFKSVNDPSVGGSLDAYRDMMVKGCESWQGPNGGLKGNMLVFLMSMDRKSAIFYGPNWTDELEDSVDAIRGTDMGDHFRSGDFADGFIAAIDATYSAIDAEQNPAPQLPGKSIGDSFAGKFFAWLLGLVVALVIFFVLASLGINFFRRRKANKAALSEARNAAKKEQVKAVNALGRLTLIENTIETDAVLMAADLNDQDAAEVRRLHGLYASEAAKAFTANGELSDGGREFNPDTAQTLSQYGAITSAYSAVTSAANRAAEYAAEFDAFVTSLRSEMANASIQYEALTRRLSDNAEVHQIDEADGHQPFGLHLIEQTKTELDTAKQMLDAKRFGQAIGHLEKAADLLDQDSAELEGLKRLRTQVAAAIKALQTAEQEVDAMLQEAPKIIDAISVKYAQTCVEQARQRQIAAREQAENARNKLRTAERFGAKDKQDWTAAQHACSQAQQLFQDAKSEAQALLDTPRELDAQMRDARDAMATIPSEINAGRIVVNGLRGDNKDTQIELNQAMQTAAELERELGVPKPNPQKLQKRVKQLAQKVQDAQARANDRDRAVRAAEEAKRQEEEARRRRKRQEEEEAARRRRRANTGSSYGAGLGSSSFGSSSHDSGGSSWGGGSSGSWGGDSGGGSSGSW